MNEPNLQMKVLEALGYSADDRITSATLELTREGVMVTIEKYATDFEVEKLINVLKQAEEAEDE